MAQKIGHFNKQSSKNLQKYEMVQGLPQMEDCNKTCEGCVFGKHHRDLLQAGKVWRASKPLKLVHTDLSSPMQIATVKWEQILPDFH